MFDHVGIAVSNFPRSRAFYLAVFAPLGFEVVMDVTKEQTGGYEGTGFGMPGHPQFWIGTGKIQTGSTHLAFPAKSRADVDAFYRAAIAAGGRDNGAPGLRPHYHANYYGAFVFDPDGNNVEAVCHQAEA